MMKFSVFHPFLFAICPVLFLYSYNIDKTPFIQILRPLLITIIFTCILWLIPAFIFKDEHKTGLIVSIFFVIFFSYTHIYNSLYSVKININEIYFSLIVLVVFIIFSYFIIRIKKNLCNFNKILNVISITLVLLIFSNIFSSVIKVKAYKMGIEEREKDHIVAGASKVTEQLPDIYYIIVDSYARGDVIKDVYGYDNSEFLNYLRKKGFFVADKSSSNYCQTCLSVPSSLNMNYLQCLGVQSTNSADHRKSIELILNNEVTSFLKKQGYLFASFSSGYNDTEIWNADLYINTGQVSEFEMSLIMTTPLPVILTSILPPEEFFRYRILTSLEKLPRMTQLTSPFFVFAHIQGPHHPFIFGENGESRSMSESKNYKSRYDYYKDGYRRQLIFLNKKVMNMINELLSTTDSRPVIIILQADHGPCLIANRIKVEDNNLKELFCILNACYVPDELRKKLYNTITPVNTFRVIFNHYFHTDLPVIEDRNYFSTDDKPYIFIDVTEKIKD